MNGLTPRSGLCGLQINFTRVAIEQTVERAVAKRRGQDAPQADDEEDNFDVNRGEEIKDDNARTKHGTERSFTTSDVPHEKTSQI